jgi:phospholipid/cholesterol/gamma-HCH transport system substrate-binding protein
MTGFGRTKQRLLGIAFVILLGAALSLSVLTYQKAFTPVTWVTLHTDHTGLQLIDGADVKLRGVIVGEVRGISTDGHDATLRLALNPADTALIPDNVTARLLPKTLFGERYVALQAPPGASAVPIRAGSVITQDRTQSAIELERVLDDALPLLQSIAPDKLAATLGALANALQGRGAQLGEDLTRLDAYLGALNQQLPAIKADITKLATVLSTYDGALPDLMSILRNTTVTATTVAEQRDQLAAFLADTTGLAYTTESFLQRYGDRIIQFGTVTAPVLELLASYAPEYPCLLSGLVKLQPNVEKAFSGGRMHITIEVTRDNGRYVPGRDDPVYGARNGPSCRGLPNPPVPAPQVPVNDGYDYGATRNPIKLPVGIPSLLGLGSAGSTAPAALSLPDASMGLAGTAEEQGVVKPLVAAATGTSPQQVPDVAVLLWGPMMRGTVVNTG